MTCFTLVKTISFVLQRTQDPRNTDRAPGLSARGSLQRRGGMCVLVCSHSTRLSPTWGGNLPISDDTRGIKKQHTHQQEAKWVTVSHSQECKVSLLFVTSASGDGF